MYEEVQNILSMFYMLNDCVCQCTRNNLAGIQHNLRGSYGGLSRDSCGIYGGTMAGYRGILAGYYGILAGCAGFWRVLNVYIRRCLQQSSPRVISLVAYSI